MTEFRSRLEVTLRMASQDPPAASMLWNLIAAVARNYESMPAEQRQAIEAEVSALRDWLGDQWFAELWSSEIRTLLSDWQIPGLSGDRPMRSFRAFAASALAARSDPGIDRALATLNRRPDGWNHLLDQLELAALARLSGAQIEFEPAVGEARRDDLRIGPAEGRAQFTVDVSNRSDSKTDRSIRRLANLLMEQAVRTGVGSTHQLRLIALGQPARYEVEPLVRELQGVASSRGPHEIGSVTGSVLLVLEPLLPGMTQGIVIEVHGSPSDDLARARERVSTKAGKRPVESSTWVHLSFFDKLFFATEYAKRPLREQAQLLRHAVDRELASGRIRGVVMGTRTRILAPDAIVQVDARTVAVRVADDFVTRVVLIVGADHVGTEEVRWWRDLYFRVSPAWLDQTRRALVLP